MMLRRIRWKDARELACVSRLRALWRGREEDKDVSGRYQVLSFPTTHVADSRDGLFRYVDEVIVAAEAAEHDGNCKCGAACACTDCKCGN
ncbi:hypothetical protein B296_00008172 [Ensete ventricosum]|uniref:Metallothionein-like protein n=1 Tax=Ensete ventricosum TaxID=4639 RepID=A0A426YUG8_ENSVE|nr:hypothetical protein B296_00008172 [Ensete ventricosum]